MGVMRLYAKLLSMIFVFAAIQVFAPPSAWGRDAWFTLRCHAASVLGDDDLSARLVDEYYHDNRRIDPELLRQLDLEEMRLASPAAAEEVEEVEGEIHADHAGGGDGYYYADDADTSTACAT